jgi:hypothetical protein
MECPAFFVWLPRESRRILRKSNTCVVPDKNTKIDKSCTNQGSFKPAKVRGELLRIWYNSGHGREEKPKAGK